MALSATTVAGLPLRTHGAALLLVSKMKAAVLMSKVANHPSCCKKPQPVSALEADLVLGEALWGLSQPLMYSPASHTPFGFVVNFFADKY
jgi:hypothetical protein